MATQRVKRLKRELTYTSSWATNVLSVITTNQHYLVTGNLVTFKSPLTNNTVILPITLTGANTFTVPLTSPGKIAMAGAITIPYYSTGQTGVQEIFTIDKTNDSAAIIQLTAHGTGTAVVVLTVSNDEDGWVTIATITLPATNLSTEFVSISPNWSKTRLSITSIGAATTVVVTVTA